MIFRMKLPTITFKRCQHLNFHRLQLFVLISCLVTQPWTINLFDWIQNGVYKIRKVLYLSKLTSLSLSYERLYSDCLTRSKTTLHKLAEKAKEKYIQENLIEFQNSWIPGSTRPDGTVRKARRVKPGFVPEEELLYVPPPLRAKKELSEDSMAEKIVKLENLYADRAKDKCIQEIPENPGFARLDGTVRKAGPEVELLHVSPPLRAKEELCEDSMVEKIVKLEILYEETLKRALEVMTI